MIFELTDVHWFGPHPDGPMISVQGEKCAIACMPKRPTVSGVMATGELRATTCPNCKSSPLFQEAWSEFASIFPDLAREHEALQTLIT